MWLDLVSLLCVFILISCSLSYISYVIAKKAFKKGRLLGKKEFSHTLQSVLIGVTSGFIVLVIDRFSEAFEIIQQIGSDQSFRETTYFTLLKMSLIVITVSLCAAIGFSTLYFLFSAHKGLIEYQKK